MKTRRANPTGSAPLFVAIDGSGHGSGNVGGKGASLDRLVASGFSGPSSALLTSDAYRRFVKGSELEEWLVRFARRRGGANKAEAERREVERAFLEAPLPDEVRDAIGAACGSVSGGMDVAVRSS